MMFHPFTRVSHVSPTLALADPPRVIVRNWLDFPVDDVLQQFATLKDGILRGVFKQQAARAGMAVTPRRPR